MSNDLFEAAVQVMARSHAPYSRFPVGAALRANDGVIYVGCNVENASFPEGICAETAAIAHMVVAGAREILEVAVIASQKPLITPCGGCRQRLSEFGSADTQIHLCDESGVRESTTLGRLLPRAFGQEAL